MLITLALLAYFAACVMICGTILALFARFA
jgi:hypothetical protein